MNPANWKREHQVALCVAVVLGAALGALTLYLATNTSGSPIDLWLWRRSWTELALWPVMGAIIAGGIVYVHQLLRS